MLTESNKLGVLVFVVYKAQHKLWWLQNRNYEQLCSHLWTILRTIELHNLTAVYTPSSHIFLCHSAMLVCYMSWSLWCWFGLCVQSYKHDLHLALNRTRSYRNQYSQILYTGTKLQPASQCITKSHPGRTILQLSAFC